MEHYRKTSSQYVSEVKLSNELEISSAGKPYDLATRALHTLHNNPEKGVVISSRGIFVTKAVTVAELIKRRHQDVSQDTEIKYSRVEDVWEPDDEELDILTVTRRIPAIVVKFTEQHHCHTEEQELDTRSERAGKKGTRKKAIPNKRQSQEIIHKGETSECNTQDEPV